jgi:hypothetical protein
MTIIANHFTLDETAVDVKAFGYTLFWMRGYSDIWLERPNGDTWHWRKGHGRWTVLGNGCRLGAAGDIVDGWHRS